MIKDLNERNDFFKYIMKKRVKIIYVVINPSICKKPLMLSISVSIKLRDDLHCSKNEIGN